MILGTLTTLVSHPWSFHGHLSTDNYDWTSPQGIRGHCECLAVSELFRRKGTSEYFGYFEKLIGVLLVTMLLGFFYRKLADPPPPYARSITGTHPSHLK